MGTKFSSGRTRRVHEFIRAHRYQYDVRLMCRVLEVTHSGYYAWDIHGVPPGIVQNAKAFGCLGDLFLFLSTNDLD